MTREGYAADRKEHPGAGGGELGRRPYPTVWMDVTTSWRSRRGPTNGTLRVEQSYAATLPEAMPGRLRLCRYQSTRRRLVPVPALPALARAAQVVRYADEDALAGRIRNASFGRRAEQVTRRWRRSAAAGLFRWLDRIRGDTPFPEGRSGDILLLAGETWGMHDLRLLRLLRRAHGIRIAAICQDLLPIKCPQFFDADGFIDRFRHYADFLVAEVDLLIAISESTRRDILDYAGARGELNGDVRTIELGHDAGTALIGDRPSSLSGLEPGRFVLSVSAFQSRKNIDLLYRVWRRLSEERLPDLPKLVLVGRRGFGGDDVLWQITHDPIVRDRIAVLHAASDAALSWLYGNCAWTLYPSFYEGWGLPISESLSHGKFCIASNMSALEEAGQGLVKHVDPHDFVAWRDTVVELVRSPELVKECERRIKAGYRSRTWQQSAARLADLLRPLCCRSS
jgi:glycosyltransferase involved in cell wall biosynthesis